MAAWSRTTFSTPASPCAPGSRRRRCSARSRWGPRTLDLDLLLYDDAVFETSDLVVPHVEMHKRTFVLEPLRQIAPNVRHPILKKTIDELARDLEENL